MGLDDWITILTLAAVAWLTAQKWLRNHPQVRATIRRLVLGTPRAAVTNSGAGIAPLATAAPATTPRPVAASTTAPGRITLRRAPWPMLREMLLDYPHVAIKGPTGGGKTFLAQALLAERSGQFLIIDPDWEPGKWGGLPVVTTDDDDGFAPVEAALQGLLTEMKRRVVAARAGEPKPPQLTVVWDEIPECMEECQTAGEVLRRLLRRARKYNMRLIALSQSTRVKAWGLEGQGDALDNLMWIHLADSALAHAPELAGTPYPAVALYKNGVIPLDTSAASALVARPLDASYAWTPPAAPTTEAATEETTAEPATAGPVWTADDVRAAAIIGQNPDISNRDLSDKLWGIRGGRNTVKAGKIRVNIEALLTTERSAVPGVPGVPERGNTAEVEANDASAPSGTPEQDQPPLLSLAA